MTGQPRAARRSARRGWLTMAGLAAVAAVVSYADGLSLVRLAGAQGRVAYLYPLLPDGLIVISAQSLYETARARQARPRWATAGIALGAALTVAMNVAAGAAAKVPLALVDGVVPVVFFVALEIFIGHIRRGREADPRAGLPAAFSQGEPPGPLTTEAALGWLLATGSRRALAGALGVPKSRVDSWAARVAEPAGEAAPGPSANGQGPHG